MILKMCAECCTALEKGRCPSCGWTDCPECAGTGVVVKEVMVPRIEHQQCVCDNPDWEPEG